MPSITDRIFRKDVTLPPWLPVAAGLVAYGLQFFVPVLGTTWMIIAMVLIALCLAPVCFTAFRFIMPFMDPRDPDADRFAVWGGLALFGITGGTAFGLLFVPGLLLGGLMVWWRAPELFELLPGMEGRIGSERDP